MSIKSIISKRIEKLKESENTKESKSAITELEALIESYFNHFKI